MSLDLNKLERLVELGGGAKQARCPACAESGQDRKGEHLKIYSDGKFGCCVFPKDHEHRKRIFALAGERGRRAIKVRVAEAKPTAPIQSAILGRLGRVFQSAEAEIQRPESPDASDGMSQVESKAEEARTARTAADDSGQFSLDYSRTARTPSSLLTREAEHTVNREPYNKLIEFGQPVRSVREEKQRQPHFLGDGTLVIPFESDERFHWWKSGQSVAATLAEVRGEF
jgi:hypothetical protein